MSLPLLLIIYFIGVILVFLGMSLYCRYKYSKKPGNYFDMDIDDPFIIILFSIFWPLVLISIPPIIITIILCAILVVIFNILETIFNAITGRY